MAILFASGGERAGAEAPPYRLETALPALPAGVTQAGDVHLAPVPWLKSLEIEGFRRTDNGDDEASFTRSAAAGTGFEATGLTAEAACLLADAFLNRTVPHLAATRRFETVSADVVTSLDGGQEKSWVTTYRVRYTLSHKGISLLNDRILVSVGRKEVEDLWIVAHAVTDLGPVSPLRSARDVLDQFAIPALQREGRGAPVVKRVEFGYFGGAKQSWEENSKRDLAFLAKPVYRFTFNWPEPPHSGGFLHEYVFDARTGDLFYPLPARGPGEAVLAGPVFVFPRPGVQEAILIVPKDIEIKSATMDLETASLDSLPAGETHPLKDLQIVIGRSDNAHASFPKPPARWTTPDLRDAFYSVMNPQPPSAVPHRNVTRLAFSSASPGRLTVRALRVSFVTGDEAMAQAKRDQFLLVGPRGEVSRPPTSADLEALRDYAKHVVTSNPYSTDPLNPLYVAWLYHAVLRAAERCTDPGAARLQAGIRDSWWYWIAQEPMTLAKELSYHFPKPADVPADFPKAWADRLATSRPYHSAWLDLTRLAPDGGYLDPWERPYTASRPSRRSGARFEVRSAGPDGIDADGAGDDVSSWQICAVERRWLLAGIDKEAIDPARARILYLRADGRSVPTEETLTDRAICAMNLADRKPVELGRGWSPAWSPDGKRIAFASTRDGNAEIYVMDADGRNVTRLTNHPAIDQDPAWSPDGRRIAFTTSRQDARRDPPGRRMIDVAVMDADGSNVRILTKDYIRCGPRWLSNAEILFYRCDFDGVYVLSAAGGPERPVDLHGGCAFPRLSADRAAMGSARFGRDLLVLRAGLPGPIDVTRSLGRNTHPVWIGSSRLVFCSDRADGMQFDLYLMRCDGSEVTRLTETPESEFPYDAFVTPEGTK